MARTVSAGGGRVSGPGGARREVLGTLLALLWTLLLAWLAFLWIRSPVLGGRLPFLNWSLGALPLAVVTVLLLRRALPGLRIPPGVAVLAGLLWAAAAFAAWSGIGDEWALDGFILRRPLLRWGGHTLRWLPLATALAVSVGGLVWVLEARHRLRHGRR